MSYEISKIPINNLEIPDTIKLPLWAQQKFITIFAERDNLDPYYLIVSKRDKNQENHSFSSILLLMPIFEKKKFTIRYVIQPLEYYYTPLCFFLNSKKYEFESQNLKLCLLKEVADYLKKHYFKVSLDIDYRVNDARAFDWKGFKCSPRYTYIKDINTYDPNDLYLRQKKYLKKAVSNNLQISLDWDIDIAEKLCNDLNIRKNVLHRYTMRKYLRFFNQLYEDKFCLMISVLDSNEPIAFRILLVDINQNYLYDFIAAANERGNNIGANVFCLNYIFTNADKLLLTATYPFKYFDFCGANTESIAFFKSQFDNRLQNYYRIKKSI
ncbi:MAG: hypothetical protein PHY08_00695 [Candidatus Cloacimonetes bacterium]|jgi:hypothetical protein|nr:hypothetical protein [Candidatus Cloacimonadota bacterium]MDD4155072.1 hypothetical protein [Candidatus Cloacimonadota bacterium]